MRSLIAAPAVAVARLFVAEVLGRRCGCGRDRPGPGVTLLGYRCVYLLMKLSLNLRERLLEDTYGYAVRGVA